MKFAQALVGEDRGENFGRWLVREILFPAANAAALLLLVPPLSLALFFLCSLAALAVRRSLSGRLATCWVAFSIVGLTLLLFLYRSPSSLPEVVTRWLSRDAPQVALLSALGVSYCWLRSIYALVNPSLTLWEFSKYYFFFPTFTSGPIMQPAELLAQRAGWSSADVWAGAARVTYGALKFVAASLLQLIVPLGTVEHAALGIQKYPVAILWLGAAAAGLWLYLNFSAFSDIAIGLGRIFGVRVPENFRNPYAACSLTEFWRRWHITLGDWLRGNVFNPLARALSRQTAATPVAVACACVIVTMLACGLWHRTTWAFLLWGLLHGVGLAIHQLWQSTGAGPALANRFGAKLYRALAWALTHGYVSLGWVFFFPVAAGFSLHWSYLMRLFGLN